MFQNQHMKTKPTLPRPMIQSGDCAIGRRCFTFALGGLLSALLLTILPSQASAQCKQWDVSGSWLIRQSNRNNVGLDVTQNGSQISVYAKHKGSSTSGNRGNVEDNDFYLVIDFPGGHTGVYRGTMDPNGYLHGTTYDKSNTLSTANWHCSRTFHCADAAPSAAATPKPIKSSGKARLSPTPLPVKTYDANDPNRKGHGFINGLQLPTPTSTAEAEQSSESSSNDTDDQHKKNKKRKKHHHHGDDENQGND